MSKDEHHSNHLSKRNASVGVFTEKETGVSLFLPTEESSDQHAAFLPSVVGGSNTHAQLSFGESNNLQNDNSCLVPEDSMIFDLNNEHMALMNNTGNGGKNKNQFEMPFQSCPVVATQRENINDQLRSMKEQSKGKKMNSNRTSTIQDLRNILYEQERTAVQIEETTEPQ